MLINMQNLKKIHAWAQMLVHQILFDFCDDKLHLLGRIREPTVGLLKCLRPKGFKVRTYVEKCVDFKSANVLWNVHRVSNIPK